MSIAHPSNIAVVLTIMNPSAKCVSALTTNKLFGKSISLLIFITTAFYSLFSSPLFNKCSGSFKIITANDCLMMILNQITVKLSVIFMTIKITVGIGFLKNTITCIFFIRNNIVNDCRGPLSTLLCWHLFSVQLLSN